MAYNLFIAFDLKKDLDASICTALFNALERLGQTIRVQSSVWFVSTRHSAEYVRSELKRFIPPDDSLLIIEASYCAWTKLAPEAGEQIKQHWIAKVR